MRRSRRVQADRAVTAVVLASGKKDSFIVGADIAMLRGCKTAADAEALCRKLVPGPNRALLLCNEGQDPLRPGTRVRLHRWVMTQQNATRETGKPIAPPQQ